VLIDKFALMGAVVMFLFLAFWVMDGVRVCSRLIEQLSEPQTHYPPQCLSHFAKQWGLGTETDLLVEWLDVKLIGELTNHVGRTVYYPFLVLFILLISRNRFWDNWTWPTDLIVMFSVNLLLVAGNVILLQRAARNAQQIAIARLKQKVEDAAKDSARDPKEHRSDQAQKLLDAVKNLKTGAFAPFWGNPLVGAILIPSGGTAFLEVLFYLFGKGN
jgi:hypothetical protein